MFSLKNLKGLGIILLLGIQVACQSNQAPYIAIDRATYHNQLHGFWLGQCIANWTGLITEMDKI